ncbi:MAG: IS66 family transposase, partial [Monoglobales bacterium]
MPTFIIQDHMLFIHDNRVPFDNNMSERDLRKCKNRQKMAGGFRTEAGQKMYCKILSVIETCKRKGESVFGKITEMLSGRIKNVQVKAFAKSAYV